MKQIKLLVATLLLITSFSCSKEEDTPKPQPIIEKEYIVGVATGYSISATITIDGVNKPDGVYQHIKKGSVIKIDDE